MGLTISNIKKWFERRQRRILMVGLPNAGKTTILNKLLLGDITITTPAPGFQVETVEDEDFCFTVWDFGYGKGIESICKKYYENIEGIIFVFDSSDRIKLCQAMFALHNMLQDEKLQGAVLLVYANKQDVPNAMRLTDIIEKLKLDRITNRRWDIIPTIATQGAGLYEGLEWFAYEIA